MSRARKNNAREQRRREGKPPRSVKHAMSSLQDIERTRKNPTKPLKRRNKVK